MLPLIEILGVVDDGSRAATPPLEPDLSPVVLPQGTSMRMRIRVVSASGRPLPPLSAVYVTVKKRPGQGQQPLISTLAVAAPTAGPSVYDADFVSSDTLRGIAPGRFVFDVHAKDPDGNELQPVRCRTFIVGDACGMPGQPVTSPTPEMIVAYGLPRPQPAGAVLTATQDGGVVWSVAPARHFVRVTFDGTGFNAHADWSALGLSGPPSRVLAYLPVTDAVVAVIAQPVLGSITANGCTIASNDDTWAGYVDVEVIP